MTGSQTTNIALLCFAGALVIIAFAVWLSYNYPQWAEAQGVEPIGYHTDVLRGACFTLSENGQ